jgi:hypothetical protein
MKNHLMNSRLVQFLFIVLLMLAACTTCQRNEIDTISALVDEDRTGCVVSSIPDELSFDPFYEKYCDADGIPIISSNEVDSMALQQAYYIVKNMLVAVPDIRQELVSNGAYFAAIGKK